MDASTQERLNTLLDYLTDTMKTGVDFASEQAPLVAKEIALFGAIYGWSMSVLCLAVLAGCAYAAKRLFTLARNASLDDFGATMGGGVGCALACMIGIVPLIALPAVTNDAIKATFAPRVYVLEYVAKLVK